MNRSPAARPPSDTVSHGSRHQQPRAFDEGKRVRVVGEDDILLDVCTSDQLDHYLTAPNAEVKRRGDGSIRLIRLRSMGDDRAHLGESQGRSTVTSERCRNAWGSPVGSDLSLQHKATSAAWGAPAVKIRPATAEDQVCKASDPCPISMPALSVLDDGPSSSDL
jgi:hypothetical protein